MNNGIHQTQSLTRKTKTNKTTTHQGSSRAVVQTRQPQRAPSSQATHTLWRSPQRSTLRRRPQMSNCKERRRGQGHQGCRRSRDERSERALNHPSTLLSSCLHDGGVVTHRQAEGANSKSCSFKQRPMCSFLFVALGF